MSCNNLRVLNTPKFIDMCYMIQENSFDTLPSELSRLGEIATNLYWSWTAEARNLFRVLNQRLWYKSKHNPIQMLKLLDKEFLLGKSKDEEFINLYNRVIANFDKKMQSKTKNYDLFEDPIAYFSFEFGLHQSLPIYSGGLGVLSGDTVKEAADMDLNYVAIGFLYHQGYFKQKIPSHGMQNAEFPSLDFDKIPAFPLVDGVGERIIISVNLKDEIVYAQVWTVKLARNTLYLMDTNIEENKPWFRGLSARLYGGDHELRFNQEYMLASAGFKLLQVLGITPSLWHLNEGHCAFISIKRMVSLVENGMSYDQALETVKKSTIFTTHTPVPAGHDKFGLDTVKEKFSGFWDKLSISPEEFLALGMENQNVDYFNMTVLAMKTSSYINGVSKLHTKVSQKMFSSILPADKIAKFKPITNGVHTPTWIVGPMRRLFTKYIGPGWIDDIENEKLFENLNQITSLEFWEAKIRAKRDLFAYIREDARKHRRKGSKDAEQLIASGALLDPEVLTIGFARRFASYKRANLIFRDIKRIRRIINDTEMPVQIIFAGKAHPADEPGKQILRLVYEQALERANRGRIAFIENYDTHIGRLMVSGVDIWLNTPIKPYEASGTSGMKAAMNGVPHFSILDGWWAEGYNGINGWKIGNDKEFKTNKERDDYDANSLYDILENEIVPLYYSGNRSGFSEEWIKVCVEAIKSSLYQFSTRRMMNDYVNQMYLPSLKNK